MSSLKGPFNETFPRSAHSPNIKSKLSWKLKTNTPLILHNIDENIHELTQLPFLKSLENLIHAWPLPVSAYLPGIADEVNSTKIPVDQAKEYFNKGSGLCFDDANNISPLLTEWPEKLRADLGLSTLTYCRSLIYAIAKGKGAAPHFDQNINFVIQISGTKKWCIAPNEHIPNPMTRYTIGTDADPELESYLTREMPSSFPDNATEYTLSPGSLLFLPRGAWHKTEALSDALSLNFTFTAPTWIDILTSAIRARLAQSREWRATADFVTDKENCPLAIEKFELLLSELSHDVPHWRGSDILHATEMDQFPE
jgi:50S ribosomal protein L16 3-hydroxylase